MLKLFTILTFISFCSFGQDIQPNKISNKDSTDLETTWTIFSKSLLSKDTNNLRKQSLKLIDCDLCMPIDRVTSESFVPIDTFLLQAFRDFPNSKLWTVIKTKTHKVGSKKIPDYQPKSLKNKKGQDLIIYEIWFITYEPNEWAKGHEGQSHCFEFVKVNGQLKFYGLTSIP